MSADSEAGPRTSAGHAGWWRLVVLAALVIGAAVAAWLLPVEQWLNAL